MTCDELDHRAFSLQTRQKLTQRGKKHPSSLLSHRRVSSFSPSSASLRFVSYLALPPPLSAVLFPAILHLLTPLLLMARTRLIDRLTWGRVTLLFSFFSTLDQTYLSSRSYTLIFFFLSFPAPRTRLALNPATLCSFLWTRKWIMAMSVGSRSW